MSYLKKLIRGGADNFWKAHSNLSRKNEDFRGLHSGETCYIFANGGSLRFYDISALRADLTFCCSFSLIDSRMQSLLPDYNFITDSYLLYPFVFNTYPFVRKLQKNEFGSILKGAALSADKTHTFCNVTNCYAIGNKKNVSFFHHYGERDGDSFDLASKFSTSGSALEIMIGAARFMGVKKCYLFGCDYLYDRPMLGHFYSDYEPFYGEPMLEYRKRFQLLQNDIEITVVRPKETTCSDFKSTTYEDEFGISKQYVENADIVDGEVLDQMRKAHKKFQIMMEPF